VTDFIDEDVQRGADAFRTAWHGPDGIRTDEEAIEIILAAVLPSYTARVRAEALREAADAWCCHDHDGPVAPWLRARADSEEGTR